MKRTIYHNAQFIGASLIHVRTRITVWTAALSSGVRREWLEGLDDLMLYPFWDRGNPKSVLHRLAWVVASAGVKGGLSRFPLRVLTTSKMLNPALKHQQWLFPVIVEPMSDFVDRRVIRTGHCAPLKQAF